MALIDGSMTFFAIDSSYKVNFVFFCHHYHDIGHHYCCYYCNLYGFLDFALRLGGAAKGLGWFLVDLCNSVSPVRGNLMTVLMSLLMSLSYCDSDQRCGCKINFIALLRMQ